MKKIEQNNSFALIIRIAKKPVSTAPQGFQGFRENQVTPRRVYAAVYTRICNDNEYLIIVVNHYLNIFVRGAVTE